MSENLAREVKFFTTGSYATAATRGALELLLGLRNSPGESELLGDKVSIKLPGGESVELPLHRLELKDESADCEVIKYSVPEADVTHGMKIVATVSLRKDDQIKIVGGAGIGRVTRPGLSIPQGEAAINPVPRQMIESTVRALTDAGVTVEISAPDGEQISRQTTNRKLGIQGGISIIGTRGTMLPRSMGAYRATIKQRIDFLRMNPGRLVYLTPGNIGEEALVMNFGERLTPDQIIQCGDFQGFAMRLLRRYNISFVLAGHPGKLGKFINDDFQTHYTCSSAANQAIINLIKFSLDQSHVNRLAEFPTVEGICNYLLEINQGQLVDLLAQHIAEHARQYLHLQEKMAVLLFNMEKKLIGSSGWSER